jgi:CRISPR/Cas system-associated protein Cas10 (large subunit of type III CRISPR-Cas system)
MTQWLVLLDIDQIARYVFSAPFLREMRGASTLLAHFNNEADVRERVKHLTGQLIYAGGGSVLAEFPDKTLANKFLSNERKSLAQVTGTATLTGIVHEYDRKNFGAAIDIAQRKLRRAKAQRGELEQPAGGFLLKPCALCKEVSAIGLNPEGEFVCDACQKRSDMGQSDREFYHQFRDTLESQVWETVRQSKDLAELTASSNNYLGFIQTDGNAMGQRLARIDDKELFRSFSDEAHRATEASLLEALRIEYPSPRSAGSERVYPFETFIVGGDDVMLMTTADKAIGVALRLCEGFTRRMRAFALAQQKPELQVAMSAGVVFAKSNYPIYLINELAEQLLKSAKAYSRKLSGESLEVTLDFMVVTESAGVDLSTARRLYPHPKDGPLRLTQRPYSSEKLIKLLKALHKMKFPSDDTPPFPRNKLQALYEVPLRGKAQGTFDYLLIRPRLSERHRQLLDDLMSRIGGATVSPWHPVIGEQNVRFDTLLPDAVELYDFVPKEG